MRHIFIFTAGVAEAREHLHDSVINAVPFSKMDGAVDQEEIANYQSMFGNEAGFYAWGAVPGPRNEQTWEAMRVGDLVLNVYGNRYRFLSTVAGKLRSKELATRIWGVDKKGDTWEYMYLLTKPQALDVGVLDKPAVDYLNKGYRGFCRIFDEKVDTIIQDFGSLDRFVEVVFNEAIPATHVEIEFQNAVAAADSQSDQFDPSSISDGRNKVIREVVRRQGQPRFRKELLAAYEGKCAVTGCNIEAVLEAAHIAPYLGKESNAVQNGLLLRADIHTLFDLGKLKISPEGKVELHEELTGSIYEEFKSTQIRRPREKNKEPNVVALTMKYTLVL